MLLTKGARATCTAIGGEEQQYERMDFSAHTNILLDTCVAQERLSSSSFLQIGGHNCSLTASCQLTCVRKDNVAVSSCLEGIHLVFPSHWKCTLKRGPDLQVIVNRRIISILPGHFISSLPLARCHMWTDPLCVAQDDPRDEYNLYNHLAVR